MFWGRSRSWLRGAAALLIAGSATAAAANILVVRSSGTAAQNHPVGRTVAPTARIQLAAGDSLTLLTPSGTRTFRGPGTFSPSAPVSTARDAIIGETRGVRARPGAARENALRPPHPQNHWQIDVSQSGTACLPTLSRPILWRPDASAALSLTITPTGAAPVTIAWPAGAATLAWPTAIPVADGTEYQLRASNEPAPQRVRFKALGARPADVQSTAAAFIQHGCQAQLDYLVDAQPGL